MKKIIVALVLLVLVVGCFSPQEVTAPNKELTEMEKREKHIDLIIESCMRKPFSSARSCSELIPILDKMSYEELSNFHL